jgi:hypothetical protein
MKRIVGANVSSGKTATGDMLPRQAPEQCIRQRNQATPSRRIPIVLGYLASILFAGIENAVVVGGISALAAALYSVGVPKDSVIQYETALKTDRFLVMAHGPAAEIARAKTILGTVNPERVGVHAGVKTPEAAAAALG